MAEDEYKIIAEFDLIEAERPVMHGAVFARGDVILRPCDLKNPTRDHAAASGWYGSIASVPSRWPKRWKSRADEDAAWHARRFDLPANVRDA